MKAIYVFFIAIFAFQFAQAQYITEQKRSYQGKAQKAILLSDGNLLVVGQVPNATNGDVFLQKINDKGKEVWKKTFGGANEDVLNSVLENNDKSLLLVGYTRSKGAGFYDIWVIKTDANGNLLWEKMYGGKGWDLAYSVLSTSDKSFVIVGSTVSKGAGKSDIWVIKINKDGKLLWEKTYGGKDYDRAYSVIETSDKNIVIVGFTMSEGAGEKDFWITKITPDGKSLWIRTFGGKFDDNAKMIIETQDKGFAIAGYITIKEHDAKTLCVLKMDKNGDKLWESKFNTFGSASSIIELKDGKLAIAGYKESSGSSNKNSYVVICDKFNGKKTWEQVFTSNQETEILSIFKDKNENLYLLENEKINKKTSFNIIKLTTNQGYKPPQIEWLSPTVFEKNKVKVQVKISSNLKFSINAKDAKNVVINQESADKKERIYEFAMVLKSGKNLIRLSAVNAAGTTNKTFEIYCKAEISKPEIVFQTPKQDINTSTNRVKVRVLVRSEEEPNVKATKSSQKDEAQLKFKEKLSEKEFVYEFFANLLQGKNEIAVIAKNSGGENRKRVFVTLK